VNPKEYFDNLGSPMQEMSRELRRMILGFSPEIKEQLKWNVSTYSRNKNICSIMAYKEHVNFQVF
jgi:hypothetical protein